MSGKKKLSKRNTIPEKKIPQSKSASLPSQPFIFEQKPWLYIILLFVIISIAFFPVAFQKMVPPASDTIQWHGSAYRIIEYNKTHKDQALWQPNMFSGMPSYLISLPNRYPFIENITKLTDYVMNWRILLLFIGALGMFILLRSLGIEGAMSFLGAIAFAFSCHWTGLLDIGHNTKFRAIMWIPWVIWSILNLRKSPNLLGLGLSSIFLITQLRENHPQISYYLYLFIGCYVIYEFIETIKSKDWKRFTLFITLLIIAFFFMGLAVMNPYLSTWEYGKYTIRGGETGLDTNYAQGWSMHPLELISFIIPDFFGGTNQTYWGWMEFTQIYNYAGIVVLLLGFFALFGKHKKLAIFLWLSNFIFTIMSFGKYWSWFSALLLKYLPYFNKFRVPSMIMVMVQINLAILAGLGLAAIIEKVNNKSKDFSKICSKGLIVVSIIFLLFVGLAKSTFKDLSFINASEQQQIKEAVEKGQIDELQAKEYQNSLRDGRLNMLYQSGTLSLLFLTLSFLFIYLYARNVTSKTIFIIAIVLLSFIDLYIYTGKNLKKDNLEKAKSTLARFEKKDYDEFLLKDKDVYRIYPLNVGLQGKWAQFHQNIQGYHGAKIKRYQEVLEKAMGMNTINMLNTKYIIAKDTLRDSNLEVVFSTFDEELNSPVIIHKNLSAGPRAWFVKDTVVIKESKKILEKLNSQDFHPFSTAILEEPVKGIESPDSSSVKLSKFDMNELTFVVQTDKQALLVVSEVYYPAGWKAFIDGKETQIYPVNYILRGVVIPVGKHKLEMKFAPTTYYLSIKLSLIGLLASILSFVAGIIIHYNQSKKKIIQPQLV